MSSRHRRPIDTFAYRRHPLWLPLSASVSSVSRIVIVGGNTLATGQTGIKFSASAITDIPSAYDPTTAFAGITGVGRGILYTDGVSLGYVLVVNDGSNGTSVNFDLNGDAPEADVGSPSPATKTLTVGGDPLTTVVAYVIDSLVG